MSIATQTIELLLASLSNDLKADFAQRFIDLKAECEALAIKAAREKAKIPTKIEITLPDFRKKDLGVQHRDFKHLLYALAHRGNVWVHGPAGTGKTTAALRAADALGLKVYVTGTIDADYRLTGFIDAQGRVVSTEFRRAWEGGGLFLWDDLDGSSPQAVLALNAATANGLCPFPDATIKRHADCYIVATANTNGSGASNLYSGRTTLDKAFTDRFAFIPWEIDETLELHTSSDVEWTNLVQKCRRLVAKHGAQHLITPRATYGGERLIATYVAGGDPRSEGVERAAISYLRKGCGADLWAKINPLTNQE